MSFDKMPKTKFSPELRAAMVEIEEVLKKHDCIGLIMLESKGHAEFKFCCTHPSWSIFEWLPPSLDGKQGLNMKFRKARHEEGEWCTGAVWSLRRLTKMFALFFDSMSNKIESKIMVDNTMSDINNEGRDG